LTYSHFKGRHGSREMQEVILAKMLRSAVKF